MLVGFPDLVATARRGCKYCEVLWRGISIYWDHIFRPVFGEEDSVVQTPERHRGTTEDVSKQQEEDIEEKDTEEDTEEETEELDYKLCIDLLPHRSVCVSAIWGVEYLMTCLTGEMRSPLEFYRKRGFLSEIDIAYEDDIPTLLDVSKCTRIIQHWLSICETNHRSCSSTSSILPKRVIDLSGYQARILESNDLPARERRYITLSHCWGNDTDLLPKTTTYNYHERKREIPEEELSPLFQDVLAIARALNCAFVWIDSLCIIQNDQEDWKEQSYQMSDIYSNAFLNISATANCDGSRGLFFDREHPIEGWITGQAPAAPMEGYYLGAGIAVRPLALFDHKYLSDAVNMRHQLAPLLDRGWAFQERVLSRRSIHFCASELIWECNSCTDSEGGGRGRNMVFEKPLKLQYSTVLSGSRSQQETMNFWHEAMTYYSCAELSFASDWPLALAGVASRIQAVVGGRYLAGIWSVDMPMGLLWCGYALDPSPEMMSFGKAPSWSCHVRALGRGLRNMRYADFELSEFVQDSRIQIDLGRTYCESEDGNPFGRVIGGLLRIQGPFARGVISDLSGFYSSYIEWETKDCKATCIFSNDFRPNFLDGFSIFVGMPVLGLLIGTCSDVRRYGHYVIILTKMEENQYRRVGISEPSSSIPLEIFRHAEVAWFDIV